MIRVSIVVPVYNAEKFIERCVNSILKQTCRDFELLLVDDGSKDSSFSVCQQLATNDDRVKVFHKENGGASSARKYGVEHAQGEYVTFVDADDTIPLDAMYHLLSAVDKDNLDIVQGERHFIPFDGGQDRISGFTTEEVCDSYTYIQYLFNGYTNCGPWATLYKLSLFDKNAFDLPDDVKLNEDFYMNLCLGLNANKVGLIKKTVYNYLENEASVTHNYVFTSLTPQKCLFERMKKVLEEHGAFNRFSGCYYSRLIGSISSACFHNKKLLHDPYVKLGVMEASNYQKTIKGKSLCFMLLNPWAYTLFVWANKLRQIIYGYKSY